MNYKESKEILEKIKGAKRILISCHIEPDIDSVGSCLALAKVVCDMGKKVDVVGRDEPVEKYRFLPWFDSIKPVDFRTLNFSKYDLFIVPDSASWRMVFGVDGFESSGVFRLVIDHHKSNSGIGDYNLIVGDASSTCEIIYGLFKDWGVGIDSKIATCLLAGVIADTGCFKYDNTSSTTMQVARELMDLGAERDEIVFHFFNMVDFEQMKYWGEVISRMELDEKHSLVWAAVDNGTLVKMSKPSTSGIAGMFFQQVEGTDLGVYMTEEQPGLLAISFRARTGKYDVAELAKLFGGGGHKRAAGAKLEGLAFDVAVQKVLQVVREYVEKSKKGNK